MFPDGGGFNPGYHVAKDPSYPGINRDYRNTLHFLENLEPDIWGGHHCEYFDLEGKRKRAAPPKASTRGSIRKGIAASLSVNAALSKMKWIWKWA